VFVGVCLCVCMCVCVCGWSQALASLFGRPLPRSSLPSSPTPTDARRGVDPSWFKFPGYVKDLTRLPGRPLARTLLVDNTPEVCVQPDNAIVIDDFLGHAALGPVAMGRGGGSV